MFKTYINKSDCLQDKGFVVYLGKPKTSIDLPSDSYTVFSNLNNNKLKSVYDLNPGLLIDGLSLVINIDEYEMFKEEFINAQKHLAYLYCKFVNYPKHSFKIGDPYGVRSENYVEILHEVNKLENLPLLLKFPVLDKLVSAKIKKPLLLLLPGPSLYDIKDILPELAGKCLIVCLSRTIGFCLERGIEPDFVVQLDTFQRQRHFYPPGRQFNKSYLVAIPVSPIFPFAQNFRGLFFMQSFDTQVLPNYYFLKRSCLSSLLPCLGLAEALAAPQVFLAGADLSFGPLDQQYFDQAEPDENHLPLELSENLRKDDPPIVHDGNFSVLDINREVVTTNLSYFATATEAEYFAQEIHHTTGTRFFNLTNRGILSCKYFPHADIASVLALKDINREIVRQQTDLAMKKAEKINNDKLNDGLSKTISDLEQSILFMQNCMAAQNFEEASKHPFARVANLFKECKNNFSVEERLHLAVNLGNEWLKSAKKAIKITCLHSMQKTDCRTPLVCLPEEENNLINNLTTICPNLNLSVFLISSQTTSPASGKSNSNWITFQEISDWLKKQRMVLVSDKVKQEYDYLFNILPFDKVISLSEAMLLSTPPAIISPAQNISDQSYNDPNLRLGYHYLKKGNKNKAKQFFMQMLEKEPDNLEAKTALRGLN